MTTIKTPVRYVIRWADGNLHGGHFEDANGNLIKNDDIAAALNATPDLTALREAARATLDWLGPVEKSPPLLPGYGLSEEARLVAERNVLRAMLAAALNLNILKDGTP